MSVPRLDCSPSGEVVLGWILLLVISIHILQGREGVRGGRGLHESCQEGAGEQEAGDQAGLQACLILCLQSS